MNTSTRWALIETSRSNKLCIIAIPLRGTVGEFRPGPTARISLQSKAPTSPIPSRGTYLKLLKPQYKLATVRNQEIVRKESCIAREQHITAARDHNIAPPEKLSYRRFAAGVGEQILTQEKKKKKKKNRCIPGSIGEWTGCNCPAFTSQHKSSCTMNERFSQTSDHGQGGTASVVH